MLQETARQNRDLFLRDDFAFVKSVATGFAPLAKAVISMPLYVEVGRLLQVVAGTARFRINLIPFDVQTADILVIPENSYIEVLALSDDFDGQIVSFKDLPVSFQRVTQLRLADEDFNRCGAYLNLIWQVLHTEDFSMQTVDYLMSAMMSDLQHLSAQQEQGKPILSRSEHLMRRFIDLVSEHGASERNVKFYADSLALSPNYLSAFVRSHSQRSVMDWLNERTVLQAKVLLCHTDQSISDIAFALNFSETTLFSRFFHRETGFSPKEYRNRQK